jgi:hypothetical protein
VDHLIAMLIVWLSVNTGLPVPQGLPAVRQSSPQALADLRYREVGAHRRREVVGVYVDATGTIHLSQNWDSRNVADVSILVHELVHHLQNVADLTYDCPAAREKLAYQAQARWLAMFGHSLQADFGLDAMTLKLTTECLHP